MKGKINVMDHTGHTVIDLDGLTDAEVESKFWSLVRPATQGGQGMILAAGTGLADLEQVKSYDEFQAVVQAAEDTGTQAQFLARGQVVGG